jgi:hypothetical protein
MISTTRRDVFFGLAGVTAAAAALSVTSAASANVAPPDVAPTNPDSDLIALGDSLDRSLAACETARRYFNACEHRYLSGGPEPPAELTADGALGCLLAHRWELWRAADLREILRDRDQRKYWKAARAALPTARKYEAQDRAFKRKTNVVAAERAYRAALDHVDLVGGQILAAPAATSAGLAIKARAVKIWGRREWWTGDADTYELIAAQIIDAVMAQGQSP